ncbi:shikimate dehydrogenase [Acidaminobacter hydrogenoformans]|uniref:Shikimate dehydrogenase (NADP(+)) n=1 Tax=Acidaminobacter hydrogenoformans DSM 2784 TaxID=1120920 RepID=A0A1G5S728_9FIRM|nr:shikimate dehydrogenase [Acidaminobacter hydrogenoformans]SCZ82018.1 shikimate dehydrogenase [Acidaminobacter hydrogenoformans DSM 2784]
MNLTDEIRLYGLIGDPVTGSRSPWIHNTIFNALGLKAAYLAFHVEPTRLGASIAGFRAIGMGGFNITIPHKQTAIGHLDALDPFAEKLGAVNTVAITPEGLIGYNTDGPGLISVLRRKIGAIEDKKVLILGAGGAARGIAGSLLFNGVKDVGICNRTWTKADALIRDLEIFGKAHIVDRENFKDYDLVINTTSVGMYPFEDATPVDIKYLHPEADVCDIVYKPRRTRLIREAEAAGHRVIFGIDMLIEQAVLAEKIWFNLTDEQVDHARELIHTELMKALQATEGDTK